MDQNNSVSTTIALNVTSTLEWQQEVRVGVTGELVGFQAVCFTAGDVRISIYRGRVWQTGPAAATQDFTVPNTGICTFNFEPFHLHFNAGDYFTISISGPNGYTQFGASRTIPYPFGSLYFNNRDASPWSLNFATFMNVPETPSLNVTIATDTVDSFDNKTSLREALAYAQSLGGPRTITFAPSLAGTTVTLSAGWNDANDANALRVSTPITLQGIETFPGVTIAIGQGVQKRHLFVESTGTLTISNLTFTGGRGPDYGGSIWSFGSLTVQNCTFTGNIAGAEGGAIQSWGDSPLLAIDNSTFAGNTSNGVGSAIAAGANSMTLRNVTIANNSATNGSALVIWGHALTMINSIIGSNVNGGVTTANNGSFSAQSTNNILGAGGTGGLTNGVNGNLVGVTTDQLRLGSLTFIGGPNATVPLLPGSIAVDAGVAIPGITTDQRGFSRPQLSGVDIGAFELIPTQSADPPIISPVSGTFESSVQISIASSPNAIIRYTIDGSEPSQTNGLIYQGPFTLATTATVSAIAFGRGWLDSDITFAPYTVMSPLAFWRNLQGLTGDGSDDLANPSGDGVSNITKFAFNLAPNAGDLNRANYIFLTAGGTAGLPQITRDAQGHLGIEFVRRKAASNPGIVYVVETSSDLATWNPLDLSGASINSIDAIWERVTVVDPLVTPERFGRVRVNVVAN